MTWTTTHYYNKWISVKDALPQISQRVLAVDMHEDCPIPDFLVFFGMLDDMPHWSSYGCNTFEPTHWMPLPDLPQVGNE